MFDVCVTLVNTKEKEQIIRSMETLLADSAAAGLTLAFVIVDNASADGVDELARRFPETKVLKQKRNEGFGKSHNLALKAVEAKYYFVLNPDTEFPPNGFFLRRLFDFMEANQKIGIVGPKIVYPDGTLQLSCYRFPTFFQPIYSRTRFGQRGRGKRISDWFLMKDFSHKETRPVDWMMGSAMFVRGKAINQVSGFDDRFWMYAEDSDWCRRMWQAGWAVYYFPEAVLTHVKGQASAKTPGVIRAILFNRYTRVHIWSWLKYFWKWRGNHKFYR